MTADEIRRFEFLKGRWVPFDFVREYYGLDFSDRKDPLFRDYNYWITSRKGEPFRDELVDRYWLEMFLQTRKLRSRKWTATQLGMKEPSLCELLSRLDEHGPIFRYHSSEQVVGSDFPGDLWESFPDIKFVAPVGHDNYCRRLHEQIERRLEFRPDPEWCSTAEALGEKLYAKEWDAIAVEPVSWKYYVWLDFGKWMTLPPDLTSLKTYGRGEATLSLFVAAGTEGPEIPPALRELSEAA